MVKRITEVTFHTLAAQGAGTVNGSSFNIENHGKGIILINISAIGGSPTMEAIIETSNDDSVWWFYGTVISEDDADNLTETTPNADKGKIKATGQYAYHLDNILAKYIRCRLVVAGTSTPTFTGSVLGIFKG